MENTINLNGVRQTYILMYTENGIRYIFNRSIPWDAYMNFKQLKKLISLLGKEAFKCFLNRLEIMKTDINDLTRTFILDTTKFCILEIHSEWENINKCDQKTINQRKEKLCEEYGAVMKDSKISEDLINKAIAKKIKEEIKKWLIEIYHEIANYGKLVHEQIVYTSLGATIEGLNKQISKLRQDVIIKQLELEELNEKIKSNKEHLKRQNYIIDKHYNKYDFNEEEKKFIEGKQIIKLNIV